MSLDDSESGVSSSDSPSLSSTSASAVSDASLSDWSSMKKSSSEETSCSPVSLIEAANSAVELPADSDATSAVDSDSLFELVDVGFCYLEDLFFFLRDLRLIHLLPLRYEAA